MFSLLLLLPALGGASVDMTLSPTPQTVYTGCVAEVDLVLSSGTAAPIAAVDALLSWDPAKLELIQAVPSGAGWFLAAFLNDPDGINADVLDGQALFTALVNPASPLVVAPQLVVATFQFRVLEDGAVGLTPALGAFGKSRVIGTTPGDDLTGSLSIPVSISALDVPALEIPRFGTPPNPNAFKPGLTSGPVIGQTWDPFVDHSSFFPGALFDVIGITPAPSPVDIPTPWGLLLCDISGVLRLHFALPGVPFSVPVPLNCALVGQTVATQAGSFDAIDVLLANALDLTIGTF